MLIDQNFASEIMSFVSEYMFGDPVDSSRISFIFKDESDNEIANLSILGFEVVSGNKYRFVGEYSGGQIAGNITATGRATTFEISTTYLSHNLCFSGSVGGWTDSADIKFNERDWVEDDVILISELTLELTPGSFTIID